MNAKRSISLFAAMACLIGCGALVGRADTHYVWRDNPSPVSPFTNGWASAATQIQLAVDEAGVSDTVLVTNGTYDTGGAVEPAYTLTNRVMINKAITVRSVNGSEVTIIKGQLDAGTGGCGSNAVRCVYLVTGVALSGFTLTNGYTMGAASHNDSCGGGVWLNGGVVSNCVIAGNTANYHGGGAEVRGGSLLTHCTLIGNAVLGGGTGGGGGAQFSYGGTAGGVISNCMILNNTAINFGGGVGFYNGGTMNNCTLSNNYGGTGGGVWFLYDIGTINNCTLVGNRAINGGGAAFHLGYGVVNNCLLIGNTASANGGGAWFGTEYGTMNNCTLTKGNSGVYMTTAGAMTNCIVWGNTNSDFTITVTGDVSYTCSNPQQAGEGNTGANPQFANTNNNFRLTANSPCLNTGTNQAWMTNAVDLAGQRRIDRLNGRVDMGAYEYINKITLFSGH